ncbi:hypothetical protein LY78DRAFT_661840 [Colletotrichum sublineola]|nr:hypothetical protein LY78DRAFT_661840 [Colletotrichum sublineola]
MNQREKASGATGLHVYCTRILTSVCLACWSVACSAALQLNGLPYVLHLAETNPGFVPTPATNHLASLGIPVNPADIDSSDSGTASTVGFLTPLAPA